MLPLNLSHPAMALNRSLFDIPIQPLFSHFSRFLVSPLITYSESVLITSGTCLGADFATCNTAYSSAIWFVCSSPGTLRDWFHWSFSLYHIPLPACALLVPGLMHEPSVYTTNVCSSCSGWSVLIAGAGHITWFPHPTVLIREVASINCQY